MMNGSAVEIIAARPLDAPDRQGSIVSRRSSRWFYVGMATAILVAELVGFWHSERAGRAAGYTLSPMAVLHATLFSGWVVLFLIQAGLVSIRHTRVHRRLGIAGVVLAAIMITTAPPLAVGLARRGLPPGDPLAFMLLIFGDLFGFAAFAAAGIYHRRRPETHKRFMLLATMSLLPPGLSRWPIAIGHPGPVIMLALAGVLAAAPLRDLLGRQRMHPVSLWGGVALLVSVPVRIAIAQTALWHHIARWLVG
jgi:hypothetical protein